MQEMDAEMKKNIEGQFHLLDELHRCLREKYMLLKERKRHLHKENLSLICRLTVAEFKVGARLKRLPNRAITPCASQVGIYPHSND